MSLEQIAESGQCFRWKKIENDTYVIPPIGPRCAGGKSLTITECGEEFVVSCSMDEWNSQWKNYFDFDTDYVAIGQKILASGDGHAIDCYNEGRGVRILRQELWEMIVTFLISQNNNIKRIRNSVEAICEQNGGYFPYPGDINPEIFEQQNFGLGYRTAYLKAIYEYASMNPDWLDRLKKLPYEDAFESLRERLGIGPKVANCICLFGLHHVDAFPIDTHVKQLLTKYYPDGFDFEYYHGIAGIIQQYLFYYELKH